MARLAERGSILFAMPPFKPQALGPVIGIAGAAARSSAGRATR
jgi:hypothetical protein